MDFKQSIERNARIAKTAKSKRAKLLAQLPEQFTAKEATEIWGLEPTKAYHQIKMMVEHNEATNISGHSKPATYRKVMK